MKLTLDSVRQSLKAEFPKCSVDVTAAWTYSAWSKEDSENFTVLVFPKNEDGVFANSSSLATAVRLVREKMGVNVPSDPADVEIEE